MSIKASFKASFFETVKFILSTERTDSVLNTLLTSLYHTYSDFKETIWYMFESAENPDLTLSYCSH